MRPKWLQVEQGAIEVFLRVSSKPPGSAVNSQVDGGILMMQPHLSESPMPMAVSAISVSIDGNHDTPDTMSRKTVL